MQALLIVSLLIGALTLYVSGRIARRFGLAESPGFAVALSLMVLALVMAPSHWRDLLANRFESDQILSFARDIGLTGILFLAGARFHPERAWKARRMSVFFVAAGLLFFIALAVGLVVFSNLTLYVSITTAAAIAATSVWMTSQFSTSNEQLHSSVATNARSAAAVLMGLLMLVVHFFAVFYAIPKASLSISAYAIVGGYELVKIAVFFGFAWFASTKFIGRVAGRISSYRLIIGYLLIAALIFVLANFIVGKFGALAWSFVAGVLFTRVELGESFRKRNAPIAVAIFIALVFLPTFLQSHGRTVINAPVLLLVVVTMLAGKFAFNFLVAKLSRASTEEAKRFAALTLSSGEGAVIFLGFGMTRWAIEGFEYFAVLSFALISMIAGSWLRRFFVQSLDENEGEIEGVGSYFSSDKSLNSKPKRRATNKKKLHLAAWFVCIVLFSLAASARAQTQSAKSADDPVSRAMKGVEAAVNSRANAADKVIAASRLINDSARARQLGEIRRAAEILKEAQKIASIENQGEPGALMDELNKRVEKELNALAPRPNPSPILIKPEKAFSYALKATAKTRFNQYYKTLALILKEERMPVELLSVALIESGLNPLALSPKGARGMWQFMPATAQRYGLTVESGNDHRTYPELSTRAAARYLRDLFRQFGDWKLALAAYNAGENRVQRIINRTGIRDFDEMARRRLLPLETRNYVPAVLASWAMLGGVEEIKAQKGNSDKGGGQKRNGASIVQALTGLNTEAPKQ